MAWSEENKKVIRTQEGITLIRQEPYSPRPATEFEVAALARIEELEASMTRHFSEEHLAGDGPEIDRWKAKYQELEAALQGMLQSADASWEERGGGHDWAEACITARRALGGKTDG